MSSTILKGQSRQYWVSTYNNHIVVAVWLCILIGIVTIAEPFLPDGAKLISILGLSAPEIIIGYLKLDKGSINIILSVFFALILLVPTVKAMLGNASALKWCTGFLLLDLIFILLNIYLNKPYSDEIFIVVITVVLKFLLLKTVLRGYRSDSLREQLLEEMREADLQYEEDLRTEVTVEINTKTNKFCKSCGGEIEAGSKFCGECGEIIENIEEKSRNKPKKKSIAVPVIFSILSAAMISYAIFLSVLAISGTETSAVISSSTFYKKNKKAPITYSYDVSYKFNVNGKEYTGSGYITKETYGKPKGTIEIKYFKAAPSFNEPGKSIGKNIIGIFIGGVILLVLDIVIIKQDRKTKKAVS